MTAGKIIPAIATTTACITGFVQLEILKYVMSGGDEKKLSNHRSATIDLAVNNYVLEQLPDPIRTKSDNKDEPVYPAKGFTVWDKVIFDKGDLTIDEFVAQFPEHFHGIKVLSLFKAGLTEQDIKDGKGQSIFQANNPFAGQYNMAKSQLAKTGLSDALRAKHQKTVDDYNDWVSKNSFGAKKLSKHYDDLYGASVDKDRAYVLLDGSFEDAEDNHSRIPVIKYIFKKAT
jgi:hypothetical protein